MRVRLTEPVSKPESEHTYHGSVEGFIRRPKRSWDEVFAQFEHAAEHTVESEASEAETEHEDVPVR